MPVLIGEVLEYFEADGRISTTQAAIYSGLFVLGIFIAAVFHHFYFYRINQEGIRVRTACLGLVYKKVTNLLFHFNEISIFSMEFKIFYHHKVFSYETLGSESQRRSHHQLAQQRQRQR